MAREIGVLGVCLVAILAAGMSCVNDERTDSMTASQPSGAMPQTPGAPAAGTRVEKTDAEWRARLTPEQYHVCRQAGTERAYSGVYDKFYAAGEYRCVCCELPLFASDTKYDSGCGWPSFWAPVAAANVTARGRQGAQEVICARCDSHLGHVFNDGPEPTGLRY